MEGRLETRSYDDKDGKKVYTTEVVCEHLVFLGGRQDSRRRPTNKPAARLDAPDCAARSGAGPVRAGRRARL